MIIRIEKNQFLDTDHQDINYLERIRHRIVEEKIKLQIMLDEANDNYRATGQYTDAKKYRAWKYGLAQRKEIIQDLAQAIAEKRRELRFRDNNTDIKLSDFFIKIAKRRLSPADYEALVTEALKRMKEFTRIRTEEGEEKAYHYVDG